MGSAPFLTLGNLRFRNLWMYKLVVLEGVGTAFQNAANEIQVVTGVIYILPTPSSHIFEPRVVRSHVYKLIAHKIYSE
jgi:hypothetical protein